MNLYKKARLLEKTKNVTDYILFRVQQNNITEEQGEKDLDTLIARFNQELDKLNKEGL